LASLLARFSSGVSNAFNNSFSFLRIKNTDSMKTNHANLILANLAKFRNHFARHDDKKFSISYPYLTAK